MKPRKILSVLILAAFPVFGVAADAVALPGFGQWTKKEALSRRANQGENGCMLILQRINPE